jgi:hypothetical protein
MGRGDGMAEEKMIQLSTEEKKDEKFFSLKRGFIFYWKSNVFLLFSILFFLLNKNSWALDGDSYMWLFGIEVEALIILLSFIACLRPRKLE